MTNATSWFERGHVALVTGASKGFGLALARLLAREGIALVVTARGETELAAAVAELETLTRVEALAGDVAQLDHVHALVALARDSFGRLDLIVNNASTIGLSPMPALDELAPSTFDHVMRTNAFAPLHLVQHALPLLLQSGGTIVNVSSDAAVRAYPGWGAYGASKAALEHISRTLAAELDGRGVSIVVADPGNMNTELHRSAEPGEDLTALPDAESVAPALMHVIAAAREPFLRVELQTLTTAGAAA